MRGPGGGMMGRMDQNRDGQVSRDELAAMQQRQTQMFERADANRDGVVSRDEMVAMREAWRAQRWGGQPGAPAPAQKPGS
jgi:Ca2+-binding EF-hand superfamily protein